MKVCFLGLLMLMLMSCTTSRALPANNVTQASEMNIQLGIDYLQRGKVESAKKHLLLALQQQPKSVMALGAMGYYYEVVGEPDVAKKYYEKSVKLSPSSGIARNNYGTFLCRQEDYRQAIEQLMLAVHDKAYLNVAQVYENAGVCALLIPDKPLAKLYFDKALQHDPGSSIAIMEIASLWDGGNNLQLSPQELTSLLSVHTSSAKPRKARK